MITDQNKVTVRRFYEEVWNKGNVDFAFEVFAEDYIRHDLRLTKALPGPEGNEDRGRLPGGVSRPGMDCRSDPR